ncbi:hypothetical protein [Planomonospora venezuelensis]|uniref:Uncharacterized protein n=2 Tax=Planomonospora venezuelensis TaxID=1999 RepID=A0A841DI38_PLAVE|nr:hypothetical protein [Planomonospora venezuelensis]MBB5967755.1 hypothetical protein [Planomonospora venezuelensis]
MRARGTVVHDCVHRMARHLSHHAHESGRLDDMPGIIRAYAAYHHLSERTGWKDLGRVIALGLARQVHAAAPGRPARYTLCMDLAGLPGDFPKSLARAIGKVADDPARRAGGKPTLASAHAVLAECVTVQYGGPHAQSKIVELGCGRVHTSPYIAKGPTPPPSRSLPLHGRDDHRPELWGDESGDEDERPSPVWRKHGYDELRRARDALRRCLPRWRAQREGVVIPGTEVPGASELASLEHLVALLMRYVPFGETVELLTVQVASAQRIEGVVRYRIGSWLRSFRRRRDLPIDEDGAGYRRMQERLAARRARSSPEVRRAVVELAHELSVRQVFRGGPQCARAQRIEEAAEEALRAARERERTRGDAELARTEAVVLAEEAAELAMRRRKERAEIREQAILRARREKARRDRGEALPALPAGPGPLPPVGGPHRSDGSGLVRTAGDLPAVRPATGPHRW